MNQQQNNQSNGTSSEMDGNFLSAGQGDRGDGSESGTLFRGFDRVGAGADAGAASSADVAAGTMNTEEIINGNHAGAGQFGIADALRFGRIHAQQIQSGGDAQQHANQDLHQLHLHQLLLQQQQAENQQQQISRGRNGTNGTASTFNPSSSSYLSSRFPLLSAANIGGDILDPHQSLFAAGGTAGSEILGVAGNGRLISSGALMPQRLAGGLLTRGGLQNVDYETLLLRNSMAERRRILARSAGAGLLASQGYGYSANPTSLALLRARAITPMVGNPNSMLVNTNSNHNSTLNVSAVPGTGQVVPGRPSTATAARLAASSRLLNTLPPSSHLMQQQQQQETPLSSIFAQPQGESSQNHEMLSILRNGSNFNSAASTELPQSLRGSATAAASRPSAEYLQARANGTDHNFSSKKEADRFWMIQFQKLKKFKEEVSVNY